MVSPNFIEFTTKDGLSLPGLLYRPISSKTAIIYLHGNGSASVFYDEKEKRILSEVFAKKNISLLTFNNRGAHIIKKINVRNKNNDVERVKFGMAYEQIKDCILDIDGAIEFLKSEGFKEFYLMGLSTGANKICVYNYYKKQNEISKNILLGGGDDVGIYFDLLGSRKFHSLLRKAKGKMKEDKGDQLITDLELFPESIFSYKAFYDLANPDGDYNCFPYYEVINKLKLSKKPLFRYFKSINKPTLVIYGEKDEYAWGDIRRVIEILKGYKSEFQYVTIENADHGFTGFKKELAEVIVNWI